jgi:hypothetical protein
VIVQEHLSDAPAARGPAPTDSAADAATDASASGAAGPHAGH